MGIMERIRENIDNVIHNIIDNPNARRTAIATGIVALATTTTARTQYIRNQFSRFMDYLNDPVAPIEHAATTNELAAIGYRILTAASLPPENYETPNPEPAAAGAGSDPEALARAKLLAARAEVKAEAGRIQRDLNTEAGEWLAKAKIGENGHNFDETWFGACTNGSTAYSSGEDTPDLGTPGNGVDISTQSSDEKYVMINRYGTNDLRSFTIYIDQGRSITNLYAEFSDLPEGQWAIQRYSDDLAETELGDPILIQNGVRYDIGTDTLAIKVEEVPVTRIKHDRVTVSYFGPAVVSLESRAGLTDGTWTDEGPMAPLGKGQYEHLVGGEQTKFFRGKVAQR